MAKKKVKSSKKNGMKPIKLSMRGFMIISLLLLVIIGVEIYYVSSDDGKIEAKLDVIEQTSQSDKDISEKENKKVEQKKEETSQTQKSSDTSNESKSTQNKKATNDSNTSKEIGVKQNTEIQKQKGSVQSSDTTIVSKQKINEKKELVEVTGDRFELPRITDKGYVVYNENGRYTIYYSIKHKQAYWAAYTLTSKDMDQKNVDRSDDFRPDMLLVSKGWPIAQLSDYKGSSYDRGHLVPSADRNDSRPENSATFLLSNMAPQAGGLNRFAWSALENEVRRLAKKYEIVYIATGGVLNFDDSKPLKAIGDNVTVPETFYKVLLVKNKDKYYSIGYLMPNLDDCGRNFKLYAVTVDSVEKVTNIDFFPSLNNSIEEQVESIIDKSFWAK